MNSYNSPTTTFIYRGTQIVWYSLCVIEVLLSFRFVLKFLGANRDAGFTDLIYLFTNIFVAPFTDVFHVSYAQGSIFEWTTLLAMLVYWVAAVGVVNIFLIGKTVSTSEAATHLNNEAV